MLVFKPAGGPLPVSIVSISASRNADRSIAVKWAVDHQLNITNYVVERSADGLNFTGIITTIPEGNNNGNSAQYSKNDISPLAADNFYRIRANSLGGQVQYSSIVKVSDLKLPGSITVYPNPVTDGQVNIRFVSQASGKYVVQINNAEGQLLYNGNVTINGSLQSQKIVLPSKTASGLYQLKVTAPDGSIHFEQIYFQQ